MQHESILYKGTLLAVLVHDINTADQTQFFSPDDTALQIGTIVKQSGDTVLPHYHTCKPFTMMQVQECIFVITGRVNAKVLAADASVVREVILSANSALLTVAGGHEFDFLEESILFEVKQGPFKYNQKIFFSKSATG